MNTSALQLKRYPIGRFETPDTIKSEMLENWVRTLADFPEELNLAVEGISEDSLENQYRPGSWSVRQLIHHLADSHMNGYVRMKLALTEDNPTIKTYDEVRWTELADVDVVDYKISLQLIRSLHHRWVALIKTLNSAELKRSFFHPENKVSVTVGECIGLYAWHSRHHLEHIKEALRAGQE